MAERDEFSVSETLKNGVAVTVRALRASDRDKIARAVRLLDRESVYSRLFSYRDELTEAGLDRLMRVDHEREVALVVTIGAGIDEVVIGSGRYVLCSQDREERTAEVAFVVEEDYQGLGIAGCLMRHFVRIAREQGIAALEADVLARNASMLAVFARTGLPMERRRDGNTVHVKLSLRERSP